MGIININALVVNKTFHTNPISVVLNCDKGQYQILGEGIFVVQPGIIPKRGGGYYNVGDRLPQPYPQFASAYKKLLNVQYQRISYWFDTTLEAITAACRQQGNTSFTDVVDNKNGSYTAKMPNQTEVTWKGAKGNGFDGIVDNYSNLPNPTTHKGQLWYVINTTIPAALGNSWYSDGNNWLSSLTLLKNKGELLTFSTEQDILSPGTNGQVLSADNTTATGLKWLTIVTGVSSVTGTANRITASPTTGNVIVDIAATYVGQASITTLGTIITGTWNGTIIGVPYGGTGLSTYTTGDLLYAFASATLAKLAIGSAGQILTVSAGLPSWQTIVSGVSSVTGTVNRITASPTTGAVIVDISTSYIGQATITTLGTITTGTWGATTIAANKGGTGQSVYVIGDILYASSTSALSRLAIGSNGQVLTLAAGIPSWATPTTGTVTTVSVVSSNGFAGTVANATTTPAITLTTTITGLLYGNGTAIAAATALTGLTFTAPVLTVNLSTGIVGGQSAIGGTALGENLLLNPTTNATKGYIGLIFDPRAIANYGSLSIGLGSSWNGTGSNFVGSSSGTMIATNYIGTFGGNHIDLQTSGFSVFKVGGDGITTIRGAATAYLYIQNRTSGSLTTLYLDHQQSWTSGNENRIDFTQGSTSVLLSRIANYYSGDGSTWGIKIYSSANGSSINTTPNILCHGNGRTSFGTTTVPTAIVFLAAGTATASTAPLKFTSGTLLTTAETGAIEFLTDKFYATITTGAARKEITLNDAALTSGVIPIATTNGRLTDSGFSTINLLGNTYTPITTNVTNITSSTPNNNSYERIGNIVTVFGSVTITNTLAVTSQLDLSLPVASNIGNTTDLNGVGQSDVVLATNVIIIGNIANDRASMFFTAAGVGGTGTIFYSFQYKII